MIMLGKNISGPARQYGFSLVQLMVALVIGLFLSLGIIQLFIGSKQTYRFYEALSRIQENGRFALEMMSREIRMTGFTGCPQTNPVANVLNDPTGWWRNFGIGGSGAITGYHGGQGFPGQAFGDQPGNRVLGTDAITILRGSETNYTIASHNPTAAQFQLNQLHDLVDGDIVIVCDSQQTSILQLTNVNQSNVTIVHNTGRGTPGNCTKGLGSPTVCTANGTPWQYGPDAMLVKLKPSAFYIGISGSGNARSLYQSQLQINNNQAIAEMFPQEMLEGVQDMRILYGEDTNGDRQIDQYVAPGALGNPASVLAVRVSLLLASQEDNIVREPMTVVFPPDTGDRFTAGDRRLYQSVSMTISIRNRLR